MAQCMRVLKSARPCANPLEFRVSNLNSHPYHALTLKTQTEPEILPLTPSDAAEVSTMLRAATPEYAAHFRPFGFDDETVREQLRHARRDRFWGMRSGGRRELAGFFMLRGFDQGYERPAFGILIAERFAGRGLARRALTEAAEWCRRNGIK